MVCGMGYSCSNNFVAILQKHSEIQILWNNSALRSLNSMLDSVKCFKWGAEMCGPLDYIILKHFNKHSNKLSENNILLRGYFQQILFHSIFSVGVGQNLILGQKQFTR